jgi:hypothetical protein
MKRWMVVVVLSLGCVGLIAGCKTVKNLDNDPAFKQMIGKVLRTKKDLVVLKFDDNKKKFVLDTPGSQDSPTIEEMPKEFPFQYYNQKIYGILPADTDFEIVHLEKVSTIEFSFVDIYVKVLSAGKFKDYSIEIGILTDQTKKVPTFDAEYVEEIPTAK